MQLNEKDIEALIKGDSAGIDSKDLLAAIQQYPYSVGLHFYYLRALQLEDSYKFPAQLHRTAIAAMDRQALLDWAEAPLIPVEVQAAAWKEAQNAEEKKAVSTDGQQKDVEKVPQANTDNQQGAEPSLDAIQVIPRMDQSEGGSIEEAPSNTLAESATEKLTRDPAIHALEDKAVEKPGAQQSPAEKKTSVELGLPNLDSLPPAVREQILRSRSIHAKLGKGPAQVIDKEESAPKREVKQPVDVNIEVTSREKFNKPEELKKASMAENHRGSNKAAVKVTKEKEQDSPNPNTQIKEGNTTEAITNEAVAEGSVVSESEALPFTTKPHFRPNPNLSSFANFLASLKEIENPIPVPQAERDVQMERAILEQFLEINPRIRPQKDATLGENLALRTPNVSGLVTETLANHYYDQGIHEKAIQAYEILKLKVPEKSAIFAARIAEMRQIQSLKK